MRGVLQLLIIFVSFTFAEIEIPVDTPFTTNAFEALEILKKNNKINHKYEYQILEGMPTGDTFFHEYFEYTNILNETRFNKNLTSTEHGFLVDINNDTLFYFNNEDIETYGKTEFDIPLGKLEQFEEEYSFTDACNPWNEAQIYAYASLEELANNNDQDALRILADIHTFGFFNIFVDILRARDYYEKIIKISEDPKISAHAHFMLGIFYSTGLFGKFQRDEAKGLIHYTFSSDLGSIQAQMALAHKYMFGISVTQNYQLAVYYFSLVFQKTEKYIATLQTEVNKNKTDTKESILLFEPNFDKFSIRWSDSVGGLYGDKTSESSDSIRYFETFTEYENIKKYKSGTLDDSDDYPVGGDDTVDAFSLFYFATQKNYHGDYLHARDFNSSFKYAQICVQNGFLEPEIKEFISSIENIDETLKTGGMGNIKFELSIHDDPSPLAIFVGRCSQYLGHMYLRGQGTQVDYEKALYYLNMGKSLSLTNLFKNDIGLINYYGLGVPENHERAKQIFQDGIKLASSRYYKASVLIDQVEEKLNPASSTYVDNTIYSLLSSSASYNMMARRKLLELYENNKLDMNQDTMIAYYNSYLKLFENMYFDFKIPFFAFINAKTDDVKSNNMWIALIGMAIESELGYETAQSSLGSILYPTVGKFSSKKFRNSKDNYSNVYTPKRFQEAVSYFELSARHSNRDSINFLGDMYYNGLYNIPNVDDPIWSKQWWSYALPVSAEENLLTSLIKSIFNSLLKVTLPLKFKIYNLLNWNNKIQLESAICLIPRDLSKSISYYQDSASMWSPIGSFNVGWAYEYGIGVTQDLHLAKRYYDNVLASSDAGYISVKVAVFRVRLKALLWKFLGFNGRGVEELRREHRSWKQRLTMIFGWLKHGE
ncbi:ERAD-associated protein [Pichia californica]|uniref:ERAD-associated protein n=1 Tax=Pichia californica TaxID=460514 RepID=A0A9P6WNM3_9ASCO|nr:ERAD-associated protein [[Candida] californica]KAG0690465.1 ERAD-associated protein [[Candida] californica]